ncbi:MAG: S41 family peptidase [Alphaproteobacteria bacterium]|jgi:carboxyl-terminal processing protease
MKKTLISVLLSFVFVFGAFAAAKKAPVKHLTDAEIYEQLKKFALVFETARENFVEEVDEKKMLEAAMNGMLVELDPHSSYLNADDLKDFGDKSSGSFGGIGIQITSDKGAIKVISPIDDTPAYRAGIKAGDYITHIDGQQVFDMTLNQAVKKMKGRPGTKVKLTIIPEERGDSKTITITRSIIKVKSIKFDAKGDDKKIGYIRVSDFGAKTAKELKDAIKKLEKQKVIGYVLDVRNNPGGYLIAAIEVSDAFLDGGEIVSTRGRGKDDIDRTMAKPGDLTNGKPLVVLINHGSASASEIVAGAIQDNKRGLVMGSQSFGKGSVQQQKPFGDGTAIHLTIARYYTPSGKSIQGEGITPDVEVLQSKVEVLEKKKDVFSEASFKNALKNENSKNKDSKKNNDEDDSKLTEAEKELRDYQLQRAMDMIRAMAKMKSENKKK